MNNREVVEQFRDGVINEINHSAASEDVKDQLVEAVKEVEKELYETIKAFQKPKP